MISVKIKNGEKMRVSLTGHAKNPRVCAAVSILYYMVKKFARGEKVLVYKKAPETEFFIYGLKELASNFPDEITIKEEEDEI